MPASFVTTPGLTRDQQSMVDVVIGGETRTFRLWETDAPASYDYGETFTVYGDPTPAQGETRFVLIRDFGPHYQEEQIVRYRTGIYTAARADLLPDSALISILWGRILKGGK